MQRDEYLNIIAQELKQYDKEYVDDIIRDYQQHFLDAAEQGKSQEEICEALGDPKTLAEEIRQMLGEETGKEYEVARPQADVEKGKDQKQTEEKFQEEFREEEQPKALRRIHFSAGNADVCLRSSSDGRLHVYTQEKEEMKYLEQRFTGDTYYGHVRSRRDMGFVGLDLLAGLFGCPVDKVFLEIPSDMEAVTIELLNGDLKGEAVRARSLSITSFSGDVALEGIVCQSLFASSKSGDISLKKMQTESCVTETISGDTRCKKVTANTFTCNSVSGDIFGKKLESRNLYLKAVSGDVRLNLNCCQEDFYAHVRSFSGSVKVRQGFRVSEQELQEKRAKDCITAQVITVSGDVSLTAAKE